MHSAKTSLCRRRLSALEIRMSNKRKMRGTPEFVADIFVRNSVFVTRKEFADLVEHALQENTCEEVSAIAEHMPADLRALLPRKYLH
jgi:hypothetical protein